MPTRRQFLATAGSSALISLAPLVPDFLLRASARETDSRGERILVVIQLTGGNDGLNTVVPYADDAYRRSRASLAIAPNQVLRLDDALGLHPALRGFSDLLDSRRLAILQGIGYPNPDRSHFTSMDVWHTARRHSGSKDTGWLGRYLDATAQGTAADVPALHLGPEKQPLALAARQFHALSAQSLAQFRLELAPGDSLGREIDQSAAAERPADDLLSFVQTSAVSALAASRRVQQSLDGYQTSVKYPATALAEKLRSVAQLIDAGLKTRIYYVALDGFDTHSQQAVVHARLLEQLAGAVKAFVDDLDQHSHLDRTVVMMFSEFGRRVSENASHGTDHGSAAPMFLAGGKIVSGVIGKHPRLTDLENGDLKFHTDFRQVYAAVLDQWLGCPSAAILGERFESLPVFRDA